MATQLYKPLLDAILQHTSPPDSDRVYHAAIEGTTKLETIKHGVIKMKAHYVKIGKLPKTTQLVFLDSADFELPKDFKGFSVKLRSMNRSDPKDI